MMLYFYIIVFIFVNIVFAYEKSHVNSCPDGYFNINNSSSHFCMAYGREDVYDEKYNICGNIVVQIVGVQSFSLSASIFEILIKKFLRTNWIDVQRVYDNGPFVETETGYLFNTNFTNGNFPEHPTKRCVIVDVLSSSFQPRNCDEKHSRVCIIKPILKSKYLNKGLCKENFTYMSSSQPVCWTNVYDKGMLKNRSQINLACRNLSSSLVTKSTVYLRQIFKNTEILTGMKYGECDDSIVDCKALRKPENVSLMEANEMDICIKKNQLYIHKEDYMYKEGFCEHPVEKLRIRMELTTKKGSGIILYISYLNDMNGNINITSSDFWCFTDAEKYYPIRVKVSDYKPFSFILDYVGFGNYWCRIMKYEYFENYESTRVMFIENIESLFNIYIAQIKFDYPDYRNFPEYDMSNYFYNELSKASVNGRFISNYSSEHVRFKNIFLNGTVILVFKVSNYSIENLANERFHLKQIFHTDYLKKGFIMINSNDTIGLDKMICKTSGDRNFCVSYDYIEPPSLSLIKFENITLPVNEKKPNQTVDIYNVDDKMKNIIKGTVTKNTIKETIIDISDAVLNKKINQTVPDTILQNLDIILKNAKINSTESHVIAKSSNLVVAVVETENTNSICGLKIDKSNVDMMNTSISFLDNDELNVAKSNINSDTEVIVEMSSLPMDSAGQLALMIFHHADFITPNPNQSNWTVSGQVIGISTKNDLTFSGSQHIDIHMKSSITLKHGEMKICVYWDFISGSWLREGCELVSEKIVMGFDTCRCRHLTIFTQMIVPNAKGIANDHITALTSITYFSCFVSLCGLVAIFLTAILFEQWRNEFTNKIYLNLSLTFFNLLMIFLINTIVSVNADGVICLVFGGFLHYSILAAFCWMFIAAVLSYKKLVVVFNTDVSHQLVKIILCGWITPLIPVILLLSIDPSSYVINNRNNPFCYPSGKGFWAAVFVPILIIVLANSVFYIVIVYKAFIKSSGLRSFDAKIIRRKVCASFLLFFLFGLTWIFGLSSRILIMNYLFCVTAPMQGFVLFVFFILNNAKTRNMWYKKLRLNRTNETNSNETTQTFKLRENGRSTKSTTK